MEILKSILPRWVLVDGTPHLVNEFAGLSPKNRPLAFCPLCNTNVMLKIGEERVPHYAHIPNVVCSASQPETVIHLNAKYYLYTLLKQTQTISIQISCARHCGKQQRLAWLENWDTVNVEHKLGVYRPDITLLRQGNPIGALEVFVSHKVTQEKASFFQQSNIPGLEIKVSESFYDGDNRWTPEHPLPVFRQFPSPTKWICPDCLDLEKKELERNRLQQARLVYEQTNQETVLETRLVDLYFKSGKKYREMYFIVEKCVNSKKTRIWVKTENGRVLAVEEPPTEKSLEKLHWAVKEYLNGRTKQGALVDNYIDWQPWVPRKKYVARDTDRYPFRYRWDEIKKEWFRVIPQNAKPDPAPIPKLPASADTFYPSLFSKVGICRYCGIRTSDWIEFDGKTALCTCRDCQNKL